MKIKSMLQPHEVCIAAGIDREAAVKVLRLMADRGFGELAALAYHCVEPPIAVCRVDGLDAPNVCPECDESLRGKALRFDLALMEAGE